MSSTPPLIVRPSTSADRQSVLRLMTQYYKFYQVTPPCDDSVHSLLDLLLNQPDRGIQFLCEINTQVAGFATLYTTFSTLRAQKAMVMNDLFVDPQYRRNGVGSALMTQCRDYVRQNGFAFMEWVTSRDNLTAQRFYESQGAAQSDWVTYSM